MSQHSLNYTTQISPASRWQSKSHYSSWSLLQFWSTNPSPHFRWQAVCRDQQ